MLNKKLTTANVTVKNDGNQQMVRVQQMKRDQLLCKQALKQRESWISDDDISSDVITTSSRWEIQSQAFHDQRLDNQLQTYRYNQLDIQTQAIFIQSRATVDPVEGYMLCISSRQRIQQKRKAVVDMNQQ
ncbi:hypothetical protein F511_32307 [Dorcoceras hygrometricum]|uniref:Uncharacterized protein n=1 Tax=Dorcoceras hygrometricum TaxID=472368 RepID=A0A2Z7CH60_9LAMI|nr:hypothetical protein F511_32307 [Dorcoceras hygrometricum]